MKTNIWQKRIGILLALALFPTWTALAQQNTAPKNQYFKGNVVPLAKVVEKWDIKLDPAAAPHWLALVAEDGKVYPIIKEVGSRMYFMDKSLLNRPMRLTARLHAEANLLQIINAHSYKDGKLHEIYYWCEICIIRRSFPGVCDCCGAPMEFREVLLK